MRGGKNGPNYSAEDVEKAAADLQGVGVNERLIVDCSHANSEKDFRNQGKVWRDVWKQIDEGDSSIVGVMLESYLKEGKQKITSGWGELKYGVSVTDGCIGFEETEELILEAYEG